MRHDPPILEPLPRARAVGERPLVPGNVDASVRARAIGEHPLVPGLVPETPRERALLADPELRAGLAWGRPRPGHPEGAVGRHVADILAAIDHGPLRADLRFLALVHDAAKVRVRPELGWSRDNDHAVLARRLAERHTGDPRLLEAVELHDEPFWIWRTGGDAADLHALLARVPDVELFLRFVELDAGTAGKDLGLLAWVRAATGVAAARRARLAA